MDQINQFKMNKSTGNINIFWKKYIKKPIYQCRSEIQNTSKTFENFLSPVEKNMEYRDLTFDEFEKVSSQ